MRMLCDEAERAIPCLLDEELDATLTAELQDHLHDCAPCRARLLEEQGLREALRRVAEQTVAPARLRRRVHNTLVQHRAQREQARDSEHRTTKWVPAVVAAMILLSFVWRGAQAPTGQAFRQAAMQAVQADLPMDVTVRANNLQPLQSYFTGRLPFAPEIPRFEKTAVKLRGGRVVRMGDRQAAFVRYDTPNGQLAIFVREADIRVPSEVAPMYRVGQRRVAFERHRGYTTAHWHASGLSYSVVSELPVEAVAHMLGTTAMMVAPSGVAPSGHGRSGRVHP